MYSIPLLNHFLLNMFSTFLPVCSPITLACLLLLQQWWTRLGRFPDGVPISPSTLIEHVFTEHLPRARPWPVHSPRWHILKYHNIVQDHCQLPKCSAQIRKSCPLWADTALSTHSLASWKPFYVKKKAPHHPSGHRPCGAHSLASRLRTGLSPACPSSKCPGQAQFSPRCSVPKAVHFS